MIVQVACAVFKAVRRGTERDVCCVFITCSTMCICSPTVHLLYFIAQYHVLDKLGVFLDGILVNIPVKI